MSQEERHPNVELNIDSLSLQGFDHVNRAWLAAAVKRELARLLTQADGLGTIKPQDFAQLDAGAISISVTEKTENLGNKIAQAVFQSVTKYYVSANTGSSKGYDLHNSDQLGLENYGLTSHQGVPVK